MKTRPMTKADIVGIMVSAGHLREEDAPRVLAGELPGEIDYEQPLFRLIPKDTWEKPVVDIPFTWRCDMPFKSKAQRGYLHANEPEVAAKFEEEQKKSGKPVPKKKKKAAKK